MKEIRIPRGKSVDDQSWPEMRQVMELINNPEIISPALRETMLSRSADATAGAQRSAMDQLRTATGGRGGAFVAGAADIGRAATEQDLTAQRDTDIQAATLNRQGQLDAINTTRGSLGADTANQGQFWQWLSDLYSGTRYGTPDLSAGAGVAGLGSIMGQAPWAQGGGGAGGGAGDFWSQLMGGLNAQGFGNRTLVGGNQWGNVTPNFYGVGATAQAPQYQGGTSPQEAQKMIAENRAQRQTSNAASAAQAAGTTPPIAGMGIPEPTPATPEQRQSWGIRI